MRGRRRCGFSLIAVMLVAGCSPTPSPAPASASPTGSAAPSAAPTAIASSAAVASPAPSPVADPRFAGFEPCYPSEPWLCDTIDVPLDRHDPAAGTIALSMHVLPREDLSTPGGVPFFTTPGGPGVEGFSNFALYGQLLAANHRRRDIVTIDPRGIGRSEAIDCPELQAGYATTSELRADVRACAKTLKGRTDRYGSANRAMDLEAVRERLGYETIDYYAPSYGSVDAQAYAVRYPDRLHALVFDSGFSVTEPTHLLWLGQNTPAAVIDILALWCVRFTVCDTGYPNARGLLVGLASRLRLEPVIGTPTGPAGSAPIVVDGFALASLFVSGERLTLLNAADHLHDGDPQPLIDLAAAHPPLLPHGDGDVAEFSSGANVAGWCNDQVYPWAQTDPLAVRLKKYDAVIHDSRSLFQPFSVKDWGEMEMLSRCLDWPVPNHYDPVIPDGATFPDVPTLVLSGDEDTDILTVMSRTLLDEFPNTEFVLVAGAGHPTMSRPDGCVPTIITTFLETLRAGDTTCAATPP